MDKKIKQVFLLLMFLFCWSESLFAQGNMAVITGIVTDET